MSFKITSRDGNCKSTRRFKSFKGARAYFERMVGYTMEQVLSDRTDAVIDVESLRYLRGVSAYGTVVEFVNETRAAAAAASTLPDADAGATAAAAAAAIASTLPDADAGATAAAAAIASTLPDADAGATAAAADTDTDTVSGALAMHKIATTIATALQKRHITADAIAPYGAADAALDTDTDTDAGALAMNTTAAITTAITADAIAPYGVADAALDILREESRNYGAAGAAVWTALISAVLAGVAIDACRTAMREGGVPKGTANVYAAQVAALADAGQLTAGVPQSVGAKVYAAARKAKRDAEVPADAEAPVDAALAKPKDVIVLSGGLTVTMLPPAIDGVIYIDPAACAAMLRTLGWSVTAPGEAPAQVAPVRSREPAVTA